MNTRSQEQEHKKGKKTHNRGCFMIRHPFIHPSIHYVSQTKGSAQTKKQTHERKRERGREREKEGSTIRNSSSKLSAAEPFIPFNSTTRLRKRLAVMDESSSFHSRRMYKLLVSTHRYKRVVGRKRGRKGKTGSKAYHGIGSIPIQRKKKKRDMFPLGHDTSRGTSLPTSLRSYACLVQRAARSGVWGDMGRGAQGHQEGEESITQSANIDQHNSKHSSSFPSGNSGGKHQEADFWFSTFYIVKCLSARSRRYWKEGCR